MLLQESNKLYCLIDCDSFYASCEILRNPKLQGKAVCVCRDKDIVLASSYEAKKLWVKTGTASRDARKILGNHWVFIEPDFAWYGIISNKLNQFLDSFVNHTEVFSIDETFCDITWLPELYKLTPEKFAYYLKLKIKKEIGIPTSIWVARTKLLAKLFSDINKSFGEYAWLDDDMNDALFKTLDVDEICFIWEARSEHLRSHWYTTVYDFKYADHNFVKKLLGMDGLKVRMELHNYNILSFANTQKPKNITRSRSFHPEFTKDKELLWCHLLHNVDKAYSEMIKWKLATRYVRVRLKDKDFLSHSQDMRLDHYTNDKATLLRHIKTLFDQWYKSWIWYRTTGIVFWPLKDTLHLPKDDLFTYHISQRSVKIQSTVDMINKRYGKDCISNWSLSQNTIYNKTEAKDNFISFEV